MLLDRIPRLLRGKKMLLTLIRSFAKPIVSMVPLSLYRILVGDGRSLYLNAAFEKKIGDALSNPVWNTSDSKVHPCETVIKK